MVTRQAWVGAAGPQPLDTPGCRPGSAAPPSPYWISFSALRAALWTDRALTWQQVVVDHELPAALLAALRDDPAGCGVHLAHHDIGLTRNSALQATTFVTRDARTAGYKPATLRQLAGTAALRRRTGAPWSAWTVRAHHGGLYDPEQRRFRRVPTPDAIWRRDREEDVAWIEYDAGSHTRSVLTEKLRDYAAPAQRSGPPRVQIWGAATEARVWTIHQVAAEALTPEAFDRFRVMTVDWRPQVQPQDCLGRPLRKGEKR